MGTVHGYSSCRIGATSGRGPHAVLMAASSWSPLVLVVRSILVLSLRSPSRVIHNALRRLLQYSTPPGNTHTRIGGNASLMIHSSVLAPSVSYGGVIRTTRAPPALGCHGSPRVLRHLAGCRPHLCSGALGSALPRCHLRSGALGTAPGAPCACPLVADPPRGTTVPLCSHTPP